MVIAALVSVPVDAAPVAVRFREGMTHGFLLVRSLVGEIIGQGEMTQLVKGADLLESQLVSGSRTALCTMKKWSSRNSVCLR